MYLCSFKIRYVIFGLLALTQFAFGEFDIKDREQTDPLLKIKTCRAGLLSEDHELFTEIDPTRAEIQRGRKPNSYKKLWGKYDVFMVHALSEGENGFIDFSGITETNKGTLKLYIKNHRYGDHDIVIKVDGAVVEKESIEDGSWNSFRVKFNKQKVLLEEKGSRKGVGPMK